ncbi:MAG: hypothetical protein ACLR3C_02300 [Eggerthella lenta]
MKTSRYRGHVLATITDRDLYYGGIGESYQVGQVLIFAAGTKPKPGSEMACADNMAAATEYLDGGGSPAAIPEPARLQEDPAPAPQAPSDGRLEAIVAEARMAAEALERDAAAQRRHTDALEAELAAAAAARDRRKPAGGRATGRSSRRRSEPQNPRPPSEPLRRRWSGRGGSRPPRRHRGSGNRGQGEAEAQLEEAASARDEALARLGSLERDAASFAVAKGAAETEAEEARAPSSGARRDAQRRSKTSCRQAPKASKQPERSPCSRTRCPRLPTSSTPRAARRRQRRGGYGNSTTGCPS